MAQDVLFNVAGEIIKKLGSVALQEIGLWWGLKEELQKLKNTTTTIQAVLLDAEEKSAQNNQVKNWLGELKEAVYDADDLLDDFSLKLMGHKIKAIRERLDDIAKNRHAFHFVEHSTENPFTARERDQTISFVAEEEVIGRDDDKKKILELLFDSNTEDNVSVIPIVGIGGLGKTTLAQLVYSDKNVTDKFELKMWVCVSDVFDIKALLTCGARGSRILVTTRSEKVAGITSGKKTHYSLKGLDLDKSWSLFKKIVFEGKEPESPNVKNNGKRIIEKCVGVPLAIKTIASLLYFRDPEREWLPFLENDLSKIAQNENVILNTLKLSYDHLSSHLKHCFAYCALFPKDYVIDVKKLIHLWAAQGFIESSSSSLCDEDIGLQYFTELWWRSFFQEVKRDELGNVESCKMHDLMHDLATSVAGKGICIINSKEKSVDGSVRHVSFDFWLYSSQQIPAGLSNALKLRTFLLPRTEQIGRRKFWVLGYMSRFHQLDNRKVNCGQLWLGKLKEVVYDADDLLDDFSTEALRRQVGHKIKAIRERLDAIAKDRQDYPLDLVERFREAPLLSRGRDQTISYVVEKTLKSIGKELGNFELDQLQTRLRNEISGKKYCLVLDDVWNEDLQKWLDLKTLIHQWIAHGFIELSNKSACIEDIGIEYFMDLCWRSFFQNVKRDGFGNIQSCTMHDLMHDLATLVAGKEISIMNSKEKSVDERVRHVKLDFRLDSSDIIPVVLKIKALSNSITNLQNLQVLNVSGCQYLKELPEDIKNLSNLRHLYCHNCYSLTHMPCGLGQLTSLQTLTWFVVAKDSSISKNVGGLDELNSLYNLNGSLQIRNLGFVKNGKVNPNLEKLLLQSLVLVSSRYGDARGDVNGDSEEMALQNLRPNSNLKELKVYQYGGRSFPSWLSSLTNLVHILIIQLEGHYQLEDNESDIPHSDDERNAVYINFVSCGEVTIVRFNFDSVVNEISNLLKALPPVVISHVLREANAVADSLAKEGLARNSDLVATL
ncbi:hypothetical protein GH714_017470 [Hevea brasiliensis]|uniref:Uncharacterized protein n=1 Tax=Hevea brasiliensis TaxID=3981 RepID=A0A6A6N423_HEVBR|nr:hypothetical protein GH714_017470 [Hevea brasiliensis]